MSLEKFYCVKFGFQAINIVYAAIESPSIIVINTERTERYTENWAYLSTFQEAKDALIRSFEGDIESITQTLNDYKESLEAVKLLKEPE